MKRTESIEFVGGDTAPEKYSNRKRFKPGEFPGKGAKPARLEWASTKKCRVMVDAHYVQKGNRTLCLIQIQDQTYVASCNLTAQRARNWAAWLLKFADWAESLKGTTR